MPPGIPQGKAGGRTRRRRKISGGDPGGTAIEAAPVAGPSGAPRDGGPTSPTADMQVEWEEGPERGMKRRGPTIRECRVVATPLHIPMKGVTRGVKKKK